MEPACLSLIKVNPLDLAWEGVVPSECTCFTVRQATEPPRAVELMRNLVKSGGLFTGGKR